MFIQQRIRGFALALWGNLRSGVSLQGGSSLKKGTVGRGEGYSIPNVSLQCYAKLGEVFSVSPEAGIPVVHDHVE